MRLECRHACRSLQRTGGRIPNDAPRSRPHDVQRRAPHRPHGPVHKKMGAACLHRCARCACNESVIAAAVEGRQEAPPLTVSWPAVASSTQQSGGQGGSLGSTRERVQGERNAGGNAHVPRSRAQVPSGYVSVAITKNMNVAHPTDHWHRRLLRALVSERDPDSAISSIHQT